MPDTCIVAGHGGKQPNECYEKDELCEDGVCVAGYEAFDEECIDVNECLGASI